MNLVPIVKLDGEWLDATAALARGLALAETIENGVRRVSLENRSGATIRPEELGWRNAATEAAASSPSQLRLDDVSVPGLKVYLESWQMASPCGVRAWNDEPFDYSPDYLPNCVSTPSDFHPGERGRFLSDQMCCLRRPNGAMRLLGFTTGADRYGHFAMKLGPAGIEEFTALCACDRAELPPGGRIETESLLVLDGTDTEALFARYADRWAADSGARRRFPAPVGWCSWYYYFNEVTLADCIENADWLAAHRDGGFDAVSVIQVDAGYSVSYGDWLRTNDKFPGGLEAFAREIRARGFTPGLWVAPFWVWDDSRLFAEHPDWMVCDEEGRPLPCYGSRPGHEYYVLDATHPDAQSHLASLFATIRGFGIDYIKLDFCMVESATHGGVYHDRTATRAQALRRGYEAIRRGFGDDGFILGCTTPFAPVVGIVDAMRSSTDITPFWARKGVHHYAEAPTVPNVCRNIVNHAYLNGRLWINDPDTLIVRDDHTELTEDEVRLWERAVSLAGGSLLLSDRMSALTPGRLALARRAIADAGAYRGLFPADRWERAFPALWEAEKNGRPERAAFDFDTAHTVTENP